MASSSNFPGLKWNQEKANAFDKENMNDPSDHTFIAVKSFKSDKDGNLTDEKAPSGGTRKLSGLPKYLSKPQNRNVVYIPRHEGTNYWISGTKEDVTKALSNAGVKNVASVMKSAIGADNYTNKTYLDSGMTVENYIASNKKQRAVVDTSNLTKISVRDLSLMASVVKSRSSIGTISEGETPFVRLTKTGREIKRLGVKSPRGRAPLTPQSLWNKAEECSRKTINLPVKRGGVYVISDESVRQAANISSMTDDGKGVKFCYAPRSTNENAGRRRAKKLIAINVDTSRGMSNILVNVDKPQGLDNFFKFMGDFLNDADRKNMRNAFNRRSSSLKAKSPSGKSKRRSPKSVQKKKKAAETIPSEYSEYSERSLSEEYSEAASEYSAELSEEPVQPAPAQPVELVKSSRTPTTSQPKGSSIPAGQPGKQRMGGKSGKAKQNV